MNLAGFMEPGFGRLPLEHGIQKLSIKVLSVIEQNPKATSS